MSTVNTDTAVYSVLGMHCSDCSVKVQKAIDKLPGVEAVRINYLKKEAAVRGEVGFSQLAEAVKKAGYELRQKESHK